MTTEISTSLPEVQDKWVYTKKDYIFEIQRTSFVHYRKFGLEDNIYSARIRLLDEEKNPPTLFDILNDMRSGIEELIKNLQDIYRKNGPESQIYILFQDQESIAFTGVTSGNIF